MPPDCNAVKSVIHAADSCQFLLPKTKQEIIHVVHCSSVKSAVWIRVLVWNKVIHELPLRALQLSRARCICPNTLLTLLPLTETTNAWEQKWLIHIVFFGYGIKVSWLTFLPSVFNALIENKPRFLSQAKQALMKKIESCSDNFRAAGPGARTGLCSTRIVVCQQAASNPLKYLLAASILQFK